MSKADFNSLQSRFTGSLSQDRFGSIDATQDATSRKNAIHRFWFPAVLLLALTAGGMTGLVIAHQLNYSRYAIEVAALASYRPSSVTRVYADDGKTIIGEFALERRIPLKYEEISPVVKNAILAVEDNRFYSHIGIDPIRIINVGYKYLFQNGHEGGSTLTQQLAKVLFLSRERTLKRKMIEWAMALEIERFYTKEQIMEMYVNQIFLGAGAYGFEAGAETYFGKQAKDLTIEEAAMLAGIPKSPPRYSPTADIVAAKERRDLVLDLMAKNGYSTEAEVEMAKAKPIKLADTMFNLPRSSPFDYPVEEIRQDLEDKYTTRVAQGGLTIYSTINVEAQKKAYESVRGGLRQYDRTHTRWRSSYKNIGTDGNNATPRATAQMLASYKHPDWFGNNFSPSTDIIGLITSVNQARNEAAVRFGTYTATVIRTDMGWSNREPRSEFIPGDLAQFHVKQVDNATRRLQVELSQIPEVQSALVTLNAKNGEVIAMIGGYDFYTNRFNNATQAFRQTGSCFKPFIYAAAIEWGLTPDSVVSGAPIVRGSWQPHNYDGSLGGPDVPMRQAIAKSLNIQAIHLLDLVGIQTGAQMVRRFGITVPMAPYLPSALGATEVPLIQMVSAYSAFPNKGVRYTTHLVRRVVDQEGNTLDEWEKEASQVLNEYVASTMVSLMRGVVQYGTAAAANSLGVPLAAKTGTVNDHTDVWFIGYTPTYITGVWMGYPESKRPLGANMTGAHGALPIFIDYMKDFLKNKPKEDFSKPPPMPPDMRELFRQRQSDLAAARFRAEEEAITNGFDPESIHGGDPDIEQLTLPPPPESLQNEEGPEPKIESKPISTINSAPTSVPSTGAGRLRIVHPNNSPSSQPKKNDEPQNEGKKNEGKKNEDKKKEDKTKTEPRSMRG